VEENCKTKARVSKKEKKANYTKEKKAATKNKETTQEN